MSSKETKDKSALARLQAVRAAMAELPLKKSGVNRHMNYHYFELGDFVPAATKLMAENDLCPVITFLPEARIEVFDCLAGDGCAKTPVASVACRGDLDSGLKGCTPIQGLGAVQTYIRRYLWVALLDLCENDVMDSQPASPPASKPASAPSRPASASKPQGAAPRQAGTSEAGKSGYMEAFAATMDALHGLEPKPWDTHEMDLAVASDKKGRPANKIWFGKVWLLTAKVANREPWEFENWTADDWADQNARLHEYVGKIIDGAGTEHPRHSDALDFEQ